MSNREHAAAAELELVAGLRWSPSAWRLSDWRSTLLPLRPRSRRIVILRAVWGMTYGEIGERVGCRGHAARQAHVYALKVLREREPVGGY